MSGIATPECTHEWERAPERDGIKGGMNSGVPMQASLVFWCRKCLKVETRFVLIETGEFAS